MKYSILYLFPLVAMLCTNCINSSREVNTSSSIDTIKNDQIKLLGYEILPPTISTSSNRTLYRANIILKDDDGLNEEKNRQLLLHIYDSIRNTSYRPNAINLFLFQTLEHSESGMGQWIARISKAKIENGPTISVQNFKTNIENDLAQDEGKSLSLNDRKMIFKEIIEAEDKSMQLADKKYPRTSTNNFDKNDDYQKKLVKKLKFTIQKKYNIDEKRLKAIALEGLEHNWPMPPMLKD
ncbi:MULTISPECIES: hypothetical protein [Sphingobacterium]|jgi:hypothetical protein|uniref:hypothetical protein n=1 Tax=Sphingobacterium TaxID=28453 RepID=UPI00104EDFF2|nr:MULTISPECIES: hypothetical protein [Sphingobacterium]MCW2259184.1 hypothetical protein [Sphingobacterium kitahiroshimense]TCR14367.1 hypothetical protein EDF67_101471 [Sphingobacterium sp. JUb78]